MASEKIKTSIVQVKPGMTPRQERGPRDESL